MTEETKPGSATAGSPDEVIQKGPDANSGEPGEASQAQQPEAGADEEAQKSEQLSKENEELNRKLGVQGQELGDYREFVRNISPVLDKLDEQPELIQAIVDGKIDSELAKAVMEGKVQVGEATQVSDAHDKVKKDMGDKKYEKASPEDIEQRISSELDKHKKEIDKKFAESEELGEFRKGVEGFIANTPDFAEYADQVTEFLEKRPNIDDIEVAYNAVKGLDLQKKSADEQAKQAGNNAKDLAANAGGGASQGGQLVDGDMVDDLIASKADPNL